MFMRFFMLFIICLLIPNVNARIIIICNDENERLEDVVISVISKNDSTLNYSSVSDRDGNVELKSGVDNKIVHAYRLGYNAYSVIGELLPDTICLHRVATDLETVEVIGNKEMVKAEAGKFIFLPGGLSTKVSDGYMLLKYIPMIEINNNSIKLLGVGGSKIYINGRDLGLDNVSIIKYLKSINPNDIKQVEMIVNPDSSEEASNRTGVINIEIEDQSQGLTGNVGLSLKYQSDGIFPNPSISLMYRKSKLSISGFAYYQFGYSRPCIETEYEFENGERLINHIRNKSIFNSVFGNFQICYKFSDKIRLGLIASLSDGNSRTKMETETSKYEKFHISNTSNFSTDIRGPFSVPRTNAQLYIESRFGPNGSKLEISGDLVYKNNKKHIFNTFENLLTEEFDKTVYTGWHTNVKYDFIINNKHQLKVGYNFYKYDIDDMSIGNNIDNKFNFNEDIHCIFLSYNSRWNQMISTMLGLRMESTINKGFLHSTGQRFSKKYTDIFPTLSVSIRFSETAHSIMLNFSRNINRTYFADMNPYQLWSSDNSYRVGNPELKPSYNWNATFYYSPISDLRGGITWNFIKDPQTELTFGQNGITKITKLNMGDSRILSWFAEYYKTFFDIWIFKTDLNVYYNNAHAAYQGVDLSVKNVYSSLSIDNRFTLSSKYNIYASLSYYVRTPIKGVGVNLDWSHNLNISLSKYFNNGIQINLDIYDIAQSKNNTHFKCDEYSYSRKYSYTPTIIDLSFQYSFGKKKIRQDIIPVDSDVEIRTK